MRVAVIGAGMSGILAAIKLKERGDEVVVYEKAATLGGTWRDNTYPGLSCDVPSHVYAYSFELKGDWTKRFSPGAEIQAYFEGVARKYGITALIRFGSEVVRAAYEDGRWHLRIKGDRHDTVDAVIAATGVLHVPAYPDIAGLKDFAGACFHSARWDHSVPLDGQRVGVVGTGSTAIQIVPALAERVKRLALFQRTAQWVLPLANPAYSEDEKAMYLRSPAALRQSYDFWAKRFVDTFAEAVIGNDAELGKIEAACRANLEDNVRDPELRRRLTPNYRAACKRLIMSEEFYPALQKPGVRLVTERIERIEAGGVRTEDGQLHALDVLVLATGFDAMTGALLKVDIRGRGGISLREKWSEGPKTYLGLTVAGFPNLFTITGPGSPSVLTNMLPSIEQHVDWIADCMAALRTRGVTVIEPEPEAQEAWNEHVGSVADITLRSTCSSWYVGANIPGKPRVFMPYIGGLPAYIERCEAVVANGYEGFAFA